MATKRAKQIKLGIFVMVGLTFLILIAFGCGGGGGGGSSPHLTYKGLTTPAVITAGNAQVLANEAVNAGSTGSALTGVAALTDTVVPGDEKGGLLLFNFAKTVKSVISKMDILSAPQEEASKARYSDSGNIPGSCGGRAYVDIQVNDQTGAFSGDISFHSYCEDGVTLNGNASFSGSLSDNTFRMDFNYITGVSGSESVTMDGSIEFYMNYSTEVAIMNMMVRDNVAQRTCMIENYQMSVTDYYGSYAEVEISGRFYDPDEGYVDIVTDPPFIIYYVDNNPSSGAMTLTGDDGTSAILTALSNTLCQLEVDTDGDGNYDGVDDYNSGPISWDDL